MSSYTRLLYAGICAAAALSLAVGSASARNLSITIKPLRAVWRSLEFANNINSTVVRCPVTLEGSFTSSTISKVVGILLGVVRRAEVANASCTNGHVTIHSETLPWRRTFEVFFGTLPRITKIKILLIRATFEIEEGGLTCTAETEEAHPGVGFLNLNETTGEVTSYSMEPTTRIPLRGGLCGLGEGSLSGASGLVTEPEGRAGITIKLI